MRLKRAIITGISGQDGAYLAQLLLNKGYIVYGTYRSSSSKSFWRIKELGLNKHPNLNLVDNDLTDLSANIRLIEETQPDEVYNLAAQSMVGVSFAQPIATAQVNGMGALHLIEAIRIVKPEIRFYQASSSELFGKTCEVSQNENTPFYPRSPYGVAKLFAHWTTINYREAYGIYGAIGILFNHESPLRGTKYVTRRITDGVAKIKMGKLNVLELGNLNTKRDWGYAGDYVEGIWLMLQKDTADTYVLATGRTKSIRDFAGLAFRAAGISIEWEGTGLYERAIDTRTGNVIVRVNPAFYRPMDIDSSCGDASKARVQLNWTPKTNLESLCALMVETDLRRNLQ